MNFYKVRVYIACLLDLKHQSWTGERCLILILPLTLYFNKIKLLKPGTCHYWLPTHSVWSHHICSIIHITFSQLFICACLSCRWYHGWLHLCWVYISYYASFETLPWSIPRIQEGRHQVRCWYFVSMTCAPVFELTKNKWLSHGLVGQCLN